MNTPTFLAVEILSPLLLLFFCGRMTRRKRLAKRDAPELPLGASPAKALERFVAQWFNTFTAPEQAYLAEQLRRLPIYGLIATYLLTCFFTSGLLPWSVNRFGSSQPFAQRVWYSFLQDFTFALPVWFLGFLSSIIVTTKLTHGSSAILYRTRPLSLRYLYWARLVPKLITLIGSLLLSIGLAFACLLAVYGPVWRHLAGGPFHLSSTQLGHLIAIMRTSPPRLLLSVLTTTILIFSLILAASLQPFATRPAGPFATSVVGFTLAGMLILQGAGTFSRLAFPGRLSRFLFFYPALGSPPPLISSLVPVTLSVALLSLGGWFYARRDV